MTLLAVAGCRRAAPPQPPAPADLVGTPQPPPEPEGTIAFVRHGQLWLRQPDGSHERRLETPGEVRQPSFAPDGSKIVYVRVPRTKAPDRTEDQRVGDRQEIWEVELAAGRARKLVDAMRVDGDGLQGPYWSYVRPQYGPRGATLWYARTRGAVSDRSVWYQDLATGKAEEVTWGSDFAVDERAAGVRLINITFSNADPYGFGLELLTGRRPGALTPREILPISDVILRGVTWSPTSPEVALIAEEMVSQRHPQIKLRIVAVGEAPPTERSFALPGSGRAPVYSPDGNWLLFESGPVERPSLMIVPRHGSPVFSILTEDAAQPAWAP